jgi:alkylated DNA repair dioxygenase AlkB
MSAQRPVGSMTVLHPGLDLGRSLQAVREAGAAFIPHALNEPFRQRLQLEIQDGPFQRLPDQIGPVRQEADLYVITDTMTASPALARLRAQFVTRLRQHAPQLAGLARWWPNEAYVQRYEPGALGVSPHLDSKRFAVLVAIFTTEGSAQFALCQDRAGAIIQAWDAGPGSLALLRGPGLLDAEDQRPFHTVSGPTAGRRFSITFRMNQQRR